MNYYENDELRAMRGWTFGMALGVAIYAVLGIIGYVAWRMIA